MTGHIASAVRKQREVNRMLGSPPAFSLSLGLQPMAQSRPHSASPPSSGKLSGKPHRYVQGYVSIVVLSLVSCVLSQK